MKASCKLHIYDESEEGVVAAVEIVNSSDDSITDWTVDLNFANPLTVTKVWNAGIADVRRAPADGSIGDRGCRHP